MLKIFGFFEVSLKEEIFIKENKNIKSIYCNFY